MADYGALASPIEDHRKPSSSIFSSPRLFTAFATKGLTDSESLMSPTSILDSKPFSAFKSPFGSDPASCRSPKGECRAYWEKLDSRGVGLGILDALSEDKSDTAKLLKPESPKIVLFGPQFKIQIPSLPPSDSATDSPKSPADFGVKTKLPGLSPSCEMKPPFGNTNSGLENSGSPVGFNGLSIAEMELSEDYTCVISHGPNPKTTHIFDDCIFESCCGVLGTCLTRKEEESFINHSLSYPSDNFLSFCYNCKKNLGQGEDIYIYRGDKAFCSSDCRYKQMILEEGVDGD